jgi:hypothetical protein
MSKTALLIITCVVTASVLAQSKDDRRRAASRARAEKLLAIEKRMYETYPQRRDSPLRADNIRDAEVREIRAVAAEMLPNAIVNISGVVTGCPCEEGPACSAQVWILANKQNESYGLLLSKIDSHWKVGVIQHWWLQYDGLLARREKFRSESAYWKAEEILKEKFPVCLTASVAPEGKGQPSAR